MGSPSDADGTDLWLAWARGLSIPEERLPAAIAVAQILAANNGSPPLVVAAALAAGGRMTPWAAESLAAETRRDDFLDQELRALPPRGALTAAGLAELRAMVAARHDAARYAMEWGKVPVAGGAAGGHPGRAPAGPVIRPPSDTPPRPEPAPEAAGTRGPAGNVSWSTSLRAFLEDHSILLLSYVGGFLMVVAAVIYELYGLNDLSGAARFAGIFVLTLFFGVTADVCLLSARMRVVGRTYLAIFDALLPLVAFAAWAFLGLGAKHVTIAEAQLVAGLALLSLYGLLSLQLRSPWQAALALAAVPVVLLGVAGLTPAAEPWRGPIVATAAPLYAAVAVVSMRRRWFGPRLTLMAVVLTHVAVAFALGLAIETAAFQPGADHWTVATTLAMTVVAYTVLAVRDREVAAPWLATAGALPAWLAGLAGTGAGVWAGPAITPLVAGLTAVAYLGSRARAGSRLRLFAIPALAVAGMAAILSVGLPILIALATNSGWLATALSAALAAAVAAALRLARFRLGGPLWPCALIASGLGSVSVLALIPAVGGGQVALASILVGLAGAWCAGAAIRAAPGLRLGLRIGTTALAVGALVMFDVPPPVAAAVAGVATVIVAATAIDSGQPGWLGVTAATLGALLYWLARSGVWGGAAIAPLVAGLAAVAYVGSRSAAGSRLRRVAIPVTVVAAAAAVVSVSAGSLNQGLTGPAWLATAASLALTAIIVVGLRLGRFQLGGILWPSTLVATALTTAAVLALVPALGGGEVALACVLVALGSAWCAGAALRAAPPLRLGLRVGSTALTVGALFLFGVPPPVAAAVALVATGVVVANAVDAGKPAWLAATAATVPALAYWLARAITGSEPAGVELTWALLPAPALIGVAALCLRRRRTSDWALPLYAAAGVAGFVALFEGVAALALEPIALTFVVEAGTLYAIALRERAWPALTAAIGLLGTGGTLTLVAVHASADWYGAFLTACGLALYLAGIIEARLARLPPVWVALHRAAGLGGVAAAVALGLALWEVAAPHSTGALLAALASLLLGGLTLLDGIRHHARLLVRASPVLASVACVFLARWAGAGNAQWYVAGPGLALVACGLWVSGSGPFPHPTRDQVAGQALLASGLALLLGTTAAQSVWLAVVWAPTIGLAVEGAAAIVGGIPSRNRVLTVGGSTAIAVAGIRGVFVLAQSGLLFAGLGGLAFVLLAIAATLALLRNRRGFRP